MYDGPFRGANTIAKRWADAVDQLGSYWTVDSFIGDAERGIAVIEWSHFKRKKGVILRGDEWYRFKPDGLISEIRAYYATPQDPSLTAHELGGFDYAGRGYAIVRPTP